MGAIGGLLGVGGGNGGTGFNSNQSGTNSNQLQTAYDNANGSVASQQQVLAQLQNLAAGNGANPSQTMLNQSTAQNVQNQAAMQAGQRGAAQNVGLIARQAGQQGMQAQQQAAGQSATMQANQQLNALNASGNVASGITAAQQGEQGILQAANTANQNVQGQLSNTTLQGQQSLLGGAGNAFGTVTGMFASGGQVPQAGSSMFSQSLFSAPAPAMAEGGEVPALVSPGEHKIPKEAVPAVAKGKVNPLAVGETFPGQPKVKGNNFANDVIPKKLTQGDVIIPNSVMQSRDPERGAAEFVRAVMAKKRKKA